MNSPAIRCKFYCNAVEHSVNCGKPTYTIKMSPVYSSDNNHENKRFWDATPGGGLTLISIKEPIVEPGKEYYIDITPAEASS